jgi:hypothetical protein
MRNSNFEGIRWLLMDIFVNFGLFYEKGFWKKDKAYSWKITHSEGLGVQKENE